MSQQTTIIEKETVTVQPQVASTTYVSTDEGVHHTVGKSHTKEIVAGVAGAAGLVGAGLAVRHHRHQKYRGSSSSSSDSASPVKKSHKRGAGLKLAGAVGQYLLRKKLAHRHEVKVAEHTTTGPSVGEKIASKVHRHRSDSSSSSSDEESGHKGNAVQAAMLAAVAKKLAERKFRHHRERNVVGTTGLSTTDKIKSKLHRDSSLSSDEEVATSHKNKALVKTVALTVLPLIKNQIREYTAKQGTNVELTKEGGHPLLDNNYIKAVAAVAQNFISSQAVGGNVAHGHHHHVHSSDEEVVEGGKPTLKSRAAKAAASLAARHLIKRKLNIRKHRTLTAHGVKSSYRARSVSVSSSSSSSSSDDEHGSKLKKAGLTAVAAGVAVNLVTKLNRRRERKALRRAVVVETEPSKLDQLKLRLANLRSHSSSSSSSSSDEDVRTRKAGLHTAATAAAARLLRYRAEHRRPQLTETQYTTEINNIQPTLQSVEPVVFTDVETTNGLRNRASVIAGRRYVQRMVGRTYRQAHPRKVVLREGETLESHRRNRRNQALKAASAWALRHYAQRKVRSHRSQVVTTSTTVPVTTSTVTTGTVPVTTGTTHVSKAHHLHRHRSVSSSSSSSSSDEESHKARKVAATLAAARIATNAVRKLRRRQERKTIRREVVVEKDAGKLAGLKTRLASLRARSSSSSSSSDEETHKKKALLVAASTAAAAALLKKKYDHRRPKYTETVYTEKVGGINNRLNRLDTSVEVSSDEEYGRHLGRTSVLHRGARLFNRHTRRNYRQAVPVGTETTVGRRHPRAWVKLGTGVAISLVRESLRKRHYRQGYVQDLGTGVHGTTTTTTSYSTAPVVGSTGYTSGVNTGLTAGVLGSELGHHHHTGLTTGTTGLTTGTHTHTGLTSGVVGGTTAGLVGSNLHHGNDYNSGVTTGTVGTGLVDEKAIYKPTGGIATTGVATTGYTDTSYTSTGYTSGVTSGYTSGLNRGYELIDANVRVKRHGLTHLTYEDLGYFVTLRVEHDYLISQGHIKAGDKVKALLGLRDDKVFSLDRIIDDQTKLLIKESLGLTPLDDIKLEYVGDQVGDAGYGYGQSTGYGHGVGTTTGLATGGVLGSELGHHHHTGLTTGTTGLTGTGVNTGLTTGTTAGVLGSELGHHHHTGLTTGTTGTTGLTGTGLNTGLGHGVGTTGLTGTGLNTGLGHNVGTLGNDYYDDDYENNYVTPSQARVANVSKMNRLRSKFDKYTRHGHPGLGATGYGSTLPTTTGVATGIPAGGLINPNAGLNNPTHL